MASIASLSADAHKLVSKLSSDPDSAGEQIDYLRDACERLQQNNRKLKDYIATLDAESAHEAMHGGFMGLGCNDKKLIAVTCTRTKAQLERTSGESRNRRSSEAGRHLTPVRPRLGQRATASSMISRSVTT